MKRIITFVLLFSFCIFNSLSGQHAANSPFEADGQLSQSEKNSRPVFIAKAVNPGAHIATIADAAAFLLTEQEPNGGFPWSVGDPTTYSNVQGPSGRGMLAGYWSSGDVTYLNSALDCGNYLVPNYPRTYTDGDPRFATHDALFLEELSLVSGDPAYADFIQTNFWDKLSAGTYGENNDMNGLDFGMYVVNARKAQGIVDLSPWDLSATAVAAHVAGEFSIRDDILTAILAGLDSTTASTTIYNITGLAGGVWAAAACGADFDPTMGTWAAANSTADLVDSLLAYRTSNGGWVWSTGADLSDSTNADVQTTAFGIMALKAFDHSGYAGDIANATAFIYSLQQSNGQFLAYIGASTTVGGGVEVHAEAMQALGSNDDSLIPGSAVSLAQIISIAMNEINHVLQNGDLSTQATLELNAAIADLQQALALVDNGDIMNSTTAVQSAFQHATNAWGEGADLTDLMDALIGPCHDLAAATLADAQAYYGMSYEIDRAIEYATGHLNDGNVDRDTGELDKAIKHYLTSYYSSEFAIEQGSGTAKSAAVSIAGVASNPSVEIVELSVVPAQSEALVSWRTVSEEGVDGFYLLRAEQSFSEAFAAESTFPAPEKFAQIGDLISGAGSSRNLLQYSFSDKQLASNTFYYYQIQAVYTDGSQQKIGSYNTGPVSMVSPSTTGEQVVLQAFSAENVSDGVQLAWDVTNAEETQGYHVYRFDANAGLYVQINSSLLTSLVYTDATVEIGETYRYKLVDVNSYGMSTFHAALTVTVSSVTGVAADANLPMEFVLEQNYPNPFNPSTTIKFSLPEAGQVRLTIFNVNGQIVDELINDTMPAGTHAVQWNALDQSGSRVSSGLYLYRLQSGSKIMQKKLVLMK